MAEMARERGAKPEWVKATLAILRWHISLDAPAEVGPEHAPLVAMPLGEDRSVMDCLPDYLSPGGLGS